MSKTVTIHPVTRVEGHAKVTLTLDDSGALAEARFHAMEFRGFEKFCEGRMFWEMPTIAPRICGLCPTSHHLAAAKACDAILGLEAPPAARKLRELMHLGGLLQDHATHFFFLAAPDFLYGPDAPAEKRSAFSILKDKPDLGRKAIVLRRTGQAIVEKVGGRAVHAVAAIPGGMATPLKHEERFELMGMVEEALPLARSAIALGKELVFAAAAADPDFATVKMPMMALTNRGELDFCDGQITLVNTEREPIVSFGASEYASRLSEHVESWSYAKFPFYKPLGYPEGTYRTGPLARLNIASRLGTAGADAELAEFKGLAENGAVHQTLYYHYARLIELLYSVERAKTLLADDEIVSHDVRVKAERRGGEGVGVIEAPRGLLLHHYVADDDGRLTSVNLVVATTHNNQAINDSVARAARDLFVGGDVTESMLSQIEMALRCYDPCLSCSTHAIGDMPIELEVVDASGQLVRVVHRGATRRQQPIGGQR